MINVDPDKKNNSSRHTDNRRKDIPLLYERPMSGLHDTTITTEAKYSVKTTNSREKIWLMIFSWIQKLEGNYTIVCLAPRNGKRYEKI